MSFFKQFVLLCLLPQITICMTFKKVDALMKTGIQQKVFPGAVALVIYQGKIIYHKAFGNYTYDKTSPHITKETLFDVASLTKLMPTTAAMILADAGQLSLSDPVYRYLPAFAEQGKEKVTIKQLLTHTSGLKDAEILNSAPGDDLVTLICRGKLSYKPGSNFFYNDSDMIILQAVIEAITKEPFDIFIKQNIFEPLGMHHTFFNPQEKHRCAPTRSFAHNRDYLLQGEVDDDRAYAMGGIAGHAGIFSTAYDFSLYLRMLMHDGVYKHHGKKQRLIKATTIKKWTSSQCDFTAQDEKSNRGYGFEIGRHLSPTAFGHFGFTGTSVWADRDRDLVCILFTNRVHPQYGDGIKIKNFRIRFHDLVMKIIEEKQS